MSSTLLDQTAERRAKRDALQAQGINPYPTRFQRTATLGQMSRCPGAAAHVQPDGSVPFHPDGLDCDPTQVPPGP